MSKNNKRAVLIYILVFLALTTVIYFIPSVTGMLTQTELLTYGSITETDRETCWFIRDEKVYLAGTSGSINYYVENDVKLRKNTTVLEISGGGKSAEGKSEYEDLLTRLGSDAVSASSYKCDFNGVVSYCIDGFEGYFTPEKIEALSYDEVSELPIDEPVNLTRKSTAAGDPLYKLCKNDKWYVTCWVTGGNSAKYQEGNDVTFKLSSGDLEATVSKIIEEGDYWQIIFETNRYYEDFTNIRVEDADIVTSDYSGIIVPNKSIATVDGQVGVYVKKTTGEYEFTPIKIKASDGENSAVSSSYFYDADGNRVESVEVYDEILKNPE